MDSGRLGCGKIVSLGGRLGSKGQNALACFAVTELLVLPTHPCTSTSHYCEDMTTLELPKRGCAPPRPDPWSLPSDLAALCPQHNDNYFRAVLPLRCLLWQLLLAGFSAAGHAGSLRIYHAACRLLFCFALFRWCWGVKPGPCSCEAGTAPLSHVPSLVCPVRRVVCLVTSVL